MNSPNVKVCSKCGELKSVWEFRELRSECRDCGKDYDKDYRETHRKKLNAKSRDYRKTHKEELKTYNKIYGKAYHETHKEKINLNKKIYNKVYSETNKEKLKAYRKTNKEKTKVRGKAYRDNLTNGYVITRMIPKRRDLRKIIPPDLIELKRTIILIKREIISRRTA